VVRSPWMDLVSLLGESSAQWILSQQPREPFVCPPLAISLFSSLGVCNLRILGTGALCGTSAAGSASSFFVAARRIIECQIFVFGTFLCFS